MNKQDIYNYLKENNIWHEITDHKAVYNMAELAEVDTPYPEADAKNLFVRDDKKKNFYLITVRGDKRVNLKEFRKANGTRPLSFASEENLMDIMGLIPGAVTPLGILNDTEKKIHFYLDKHFLEEISIPEIAAYVDINKSYLQALFTDKIGCTINHYINQKRLEQAIFLLCNSSFGITDIAFASGYNSRQHFSYTFEKFYGLTPSAYRGLHARNMTTDTRNIRYSLENDRDLKGEIM